MVASTCITIRNADGVWFRTVTRSRAIRSWNFSGARVMSCGTTISRPPYSSAPHSSHTEKSKAMEWNSVHTSRAVNPNQGVVASNRRSTLRCVTTTPFGLPVEPDV